MNYKRLGTLTLLLILLYTPAFASLVSFSFVETGIGNEITGTQHGSVWEGGLMEVFFNAGYIVTNSPLLRVERKPDQALSGNILSEFEDAVEGGAEFFVLGFLECEAEGGRAIPIHMTIIIYETDSREQIFEHIFPISNVRTLAQEFEFAKDVGIIILNQIKDFKI